MVRSERIVVVGAGLAGLRAGERLREIGFGGDVTIVGDEPHLPYNRPPLSKKVLAGEHALEACLFDHGDAEAEWLLDNRATGLDPDRHVVYLEDGELSYDGLVIATGRQARQWPGLPKWDGFHTLRGLDDAVALRDAATPGSRVVIIGGGFIGCEVAGTLLQRGVSDTTIIEAAPHLLPMLGREVGEFATSTHRDRGLKIECGARVTGFRGDGRVSGVDIADGRCIDADLVLVALGSEPNTNWLSGAGLRIDNGAVVCNEHCFVSGRPEIVAAGDVGKWMHTGLNRMVQVEHWTNAAEMARRAADNLFNGPTGAVPFVPIPTFWSDQHEVKVKAVGFPSFADKYVVAEEDESAAKLVVEGYLRDELIAAVTFNCAKEFLQYRNRLEQKLTTGLAIHA